MIVLYESELWVLENMPLCLFRNLQCTEPYLEVQLIELTQSTYKWSGWVMICELEERFEEMNLNAVGQN